MRKPTDIECLYIDFDAFFAHVEKQVEPSIRDYPVGITALQSDYSALITCCYVAKKMGVKRGMRVIEARELCPDIVIRMARPNIYVDIHTAIVHEVNRHIPVRKVWSVDEVECHLMGRERHNCLELAEKIRIGLRQNIGACVTPSIGLGPNQFLAKVAAEMHKPNGLTQLHPEALPGPLLKLKLKDLPGISTNMEIRLKAAGIMGIDDLWHSSPKQARAIWGNVEGERLWAQLHGYAVDRPETQRRMFGHSRILSGEFRDPARAIDCLHLLTVKAAYRLRRAGYLAAMLSLSFRIAGGTRWSGERRFAYAQDDFTFIRHMKSLFAQGLSETTSPRRLKSVSIMLHNIARPYDVSYDLFESGVDMTNIAARNQIMTVMDNLNAKYRRSVLHVGARAKIPGGYAGAKIAFGRIPDKEDFY